MTQYIDKDALIAEIDRQKIGYNTDGKHSVEYDITRKIIVIINSLEVKEVDLDGEINLWVRNLHRVPNFEELNKFARHFFKLGFKAQKGK